MDIKHGTIEKLGSCNFCQRGELSMCGYDLIYPYREVYQITGNYVRIVICDKCLEEVIDFKLEVDAKKVTDTLTNC